ncbi:MAG: LLM class F420-dependent oxidoreductase [Chloroflexi bacterium]|nr:LLM class F420-dependent oxidoreductase [Chloroflexota bacterium]
MELTAFYPSYELGSDPGVLRDYAQAAEALGYARLAMGEHTLGADPDRPGGWQGAYTFRHEWPDPFPTFGYLAAVTERIELMTGILILPQRQTALVAKQAAQLDVLCGGRFVLGIGTGWNPVEYEALGQDFHTRGRRMDEQIELLRLLWREPVVTFEGRWDRVTKAGINPLPARRAIPIWMGGRDPRALDRVGRVGDGWFPLGVPDDAVVEGIARVRAAAERAGRDPATIGLQCSVRGADDPDGQVAASRRFAEIGATHTAIFTSNVGLKGVQAHIDALTRVAEALRA